MIVTCVSPVQLYSIFVFIYIYMIMYIYIYIHFKIYNDITETVYIDLCTMYVSTNSMCCVLQPMTWSAGAPDRRSCSCAPVTSWTPSIDLYWIVWRSGTRQKVTVWVFPYIWFIWSIYGWYRWNIIDTILYIYTIWVNYNDLTTTEPWESWIFNGFDREIILKWPNYSG